MPGVDPETMLAEDVGEFFDDPLGFVMYAYPWDTDSSLQVCKLVEPWASKYDSVYGPDAWACEFLDWVGAQVGEHGFDCLRPVEAVRASISSGHGIGKLHDYGMIVQTPSGAMRWGDLQPGDQVFGADGVPTRVLQTHHFRGVPMYRVTFDDRSYCDVSSGHLWNVRGRQERRNGLDTWRTLETIEILELGAKRSNGVALARQWEIPIQGAAQFEEREIDLHPYVMGVWLGDGTKGQPAYSKPNPEVKAKVESCGYTVHTAADGMCQRIQNSTHLFTDPVFALGSHDRYVPDDYKFNTVANRMALLEGLCDTDGEVYGSGSIGYSTTSKRLAEDIIWLARSLGCKAMLHPAAKRGRYRNKAGEMVECRDCCRVTINAPFNPFTIENKRAAYKLSDARYTTRWIDSIEPIGAADGMCISVEAPDGLYLANDFVVTHNSALVAWLVDWIMSTRPFAKGVITANTGPQLETKTWAEIAKWTKRCITGHWFDVSTGKGSMRMTHKAHPESWRADAQTCREENSESFAGLHAVNSTPFYIYDEASAIPDRIWDVSEGGMTDGEPMWFVFGNPTRNTGRFAECFGRFRHLWKTHYIDSRTVQITNKDLIARWVTDYGEDSDFVKVRVRGVFPSASSLQFIPRDLVDSAMAREAKTAGFLGRTCAVGVDVARFGDDESVIITRIGRDAASIPIKRYRELDTMQLASKVVEHVNYLKQLGLRVVLFVDGGGVGGGVVDRLRQLHLDPIEVQFGAKATDSRKYANKRAEIWGRMKDWLAIGCLPRDEAMATDLTSVEYSFTSADLILLERKEDMKRRGLASPDSGDALAISFAQSVPEYQDADGGLKQRKREYDPYDSLN